MFSTRQRPTKTRVPAGYWLGADRFDLLLRNAGAFTTVVVGGYTLMQIAYASTGLKGYVNFGLIDWWMNTATLHQSTDKALLLWFTGACFITYVILFLINTHRCTLIRPKAIHLYLLGLQSVLTCCVSLILLLLTDVLVGFLLPSGWGLLWILCHSMADFLITLYSPKNGLIMQWQQFGNGTPLPLEALFSFLSSVAAQLFCYSIGKMGALELRQRLDLARVNAELEATQQLQAETVRLAERVYISREIHDSLGHTLTALSLNLQRAGRLANPEAKVPIDEAHMVARLLMNDVRDVVSSLRDHVCLDLTQALQTLVAGVQQPLIHLVMTGDFSQTEPIYANALFRFVQECLTNTIRHAYANHVWIVLQALPNQYQLIVCDDGRGCALAEQHHMGGNGLRGMQERIAELYGQLSIDSTPGQGFSVTIHIPLVEQVA